MSEPRLKNILIVGGGTAGWMTAAALAKHFGSQCSIRLVESEDIGTIGVGEATVPPIREFNRLLELDEVEFMRATNATFKLGIQFENWGQIGDRYLHPFGTYGSIIDGVRFHHYWQKLRAEGQATEFADYNLPAVAAADNRFSLAGDGDARFDLNNHYAYHFDATLYAHYLRKWSEPRGVERLEGKVVDVSLHPDSGDIRSVTLEDGTELVADLFIDCSGFRALLMGQALQAGFEDWSHWLPVDRAWAVTANYPDQARIPPYTRTRALAAGWQWRVPLQNRTGNGHVFCSRFISEDEAHGQMLENVEGEITAEPRLLKFTTGIRKQQWHRNCVAVGLSAGFLEPLESTSIYLIQCSIVALLNHFPAQGINPAHRDQFNRELLGRYAEARNFLLMHYHTSARTDTPFWAHCQELSIPEELAHRINLFRTGGYVSVKQHELFIEHSWLAVLLGQGVMPGAHDPRVDRLDSKQISAELERIRQGIGNAVAKMPDHEQVLADYCANDLRVRRPAPVPGMQVSE